MNNIRRKRQGQYCWLRGCIRIRQQRFCSIRLERGIELRYWFPYLGLPLLLWQCIARKQHGYRLWAMRFVDQGLQQRVLSRCDPEFDNLTSIFHEAGLLDLTLIITSTFSISFSRIFIVDIRFYCNPTEVVIKRIIDIGEILIAKLQEIGNEDIDKSPLRREVSKSP